MCGRFVIAQDVDSYARVFGVGETRTEGLSASYNVAPTDRVYAVVVGEGARLLGTLRWGLIPFWAEKPGTGHINARVETVAEKPSFKQAFARRRCLIPADGFYEWERLERGKLPHFIYRRDGAPMALAGLWSSWRSPDSGEPIASCTILTTRAHPSLEPIHGRMPVMLEPERWTDWLDPELTDPGQVHRLLQPAPQQAITEHPVSTLVNDVRNNLPECIEPLPGRSP